MSDGQPVDKAMYRGIMTKMEQEEFLCDLALMYDTLEEISHLSLNLQERGMTLTRADTLMRRTIRMVYSIITCPGASCTNICVDFLLKLCGSKNPNPDVSSLRKRAFMQISLYIPNERGIQRTCTSPSLRPCLLPHLICKLV